MISDTIKNDMIDDDNSLKIILKKSLSLLSHYW